MFIEEVTKQSIYDEISRVLTEWETQEAVDDDLYNTLVKVQRYWETVITVQDDAPAATPETPKEPAKLCVCSRCLMAIESHEGQQITRKIYLDDDDPRPCDWCEESDFDTLYEIQ